MVLLEICQILHDKNSTITGALIDFLEIELLNKLTLKLLSLNVPLKYNSPLFVTESKILLKFFKWKIFREQLQIYVNLCNFCKQFLKSIVRF